MMTAFELIETNGLDLHGDLCRSMRVLEQIVLDKQ